jgi:hypothetical protein
MSTTFLWMVGFAILITGLTVVGLGLSAWAGRRKTPGVCSCDFDPDKARAKAERGGGCCGSGGHAAKPETSTAPAASVPPVRKDGCCGGNCTCG